MKTLPSGLAEMQMKMRLVEWLLDQDSDEQAARVCKTRVRDVDVRHGAAGPRTSAASGLKTTEIKRGGRLIAARHLSFTISVISLDVS